MQEDIEDNKPHLCVPTLDGNAHVIPTEVFDKIVSGEMKITDMYDWEIITRTAFSEWLRGFETTAKARVYKAAIDQLADSMAAGAWQDGPAPKDGSLILGLFHGLPYVVAYDSWEVGGETLPDGSGSPPDGYESGWCLAGDNLHVMDKDEPEKWARIIHPNRHIPASWDGPGNRSQEMYIWETRVYVKSWNGSRNRPWIDAGYYIVSDHGFECRSKRDLDGIDEFEAALTAFLGN